MNIDIWANQLRLPDNSIATIKECLKQFNPEEFNALHDFLNSEKIVEHCRLIKLDNNADITKLLTVRDIIVSDKAILSYVKLIYLVLTQGIDPFIVNKLPTLEAIIPEDYAVVSLLIVLESIPLMFQSYERQDIAQNVIDDTILGLKNKVDSCRAFTGKLGIFAQQVGWHSLYIKGELYRLGRMEYKLIPARKAIEAFRNRTTGEVILLIRPPEKLSKDGYIVDNDDSGREPEYSQSADSVIGTPVSPLGFALKTTITLPFSEWELIYGEGYYSIDMHIPPGGRMTPAACRDSFKKALDFFADCFPDKKAPAVYCRSWIFNTQFEALLPESNMAKLMREVYLFPILSSGRDGMAFIFGQEYDDLTKAPCETSIQRAMLHILKSGKKLRASGMLFFKDDLDKFGTGYYRKISQLTPWMHTQNRPRSG